MTAKEYLMQYRGCMNRIHAIEAHLNELRAIANQLRTEDGHSIALDAAVANLVDMEQKTKQEVIRLKETGDGIIRTVKRVPEPYGSLLYERYINGRTWEEIAVILNYSWRQTVRLHGVALVAVKDVIECHT